MTMFRKKPVVIEAEQFIEGSGNRLPFVDGTSPGPLRNDGDWYIDTLEGPMRVSSGDWIIKGVKGEFYPCKPDIFALSYERADSEGEDEFAGFTREMLITQILQLRDLVTMEQASLASAQEEIAELKGDRAYEREESERILNAEIDALERAEARVKKLEDLIIIALRYAHGPVGLEPNPQAIISECGDNSWDSCSRRPWHAEARAILANRAKEGGK